MQVVGKRHRCAGSVGVLAQKCDVLSPTGSEGLVSSAHRLENVSLDRYVGLREKCLEDLGILQDPFSEGFKVKPDC